MSRRVTMAARPQGMPQESDFSLEDFSPDPLSALDLSDDDLSAEDDLLPDESGEDFFG